MKTKQAFLLSAILLSIVGMVISGCGKSTSPSEESGLMTPEMLKEITIAGTDADGLAKAIGQHRGKAVLVDFWATWCPPCVKLFPHTVDLHKRYSSDDLAVITVSLDNADNRDGVLEFLRRHRANTENYQSAIEGNPDAFDAFDIPIGIPYLRIYDRSGKLLHVVNGLFTDEIDQAVAEAVGKEKAS